MKVKQIILGGACAILLTGCATQSGQQQPSSEAFDITTNATTGLPERKVSLTYLNKIAPNWPVASQSAAREMIEKHGMPTEKNQDMLIWKNIAPYKRIVVYREEVQSNFPILHQDVLEHVVGYNVVPERADDVLQYNGSISLNKTRGEISAFSEKESMNILSLNLANDIFQGSRSAEQARVEHGRLALEEINGITSRYTQSLSFGTFMNTANAGESITNKINWVKPFGTGKQAQKSIDQSKRPSKGQPGQVRQSQEE